MRSNRYRSPNYFYFLFLVIWNANKITVIQTVVSSESDAKSEDARSVHIHYPDASLESSMALQAFLPQSTVTSV